MRRSILVMTVVLSVAGGCRLWPIGPSTQPAASPKAIADLRRDIRSRVADPAVQRDLLSQLDAIEADLESHRQTTQRLQTQVEELTSRLRALEKRDVARLQVHELTGFTYCDASRQEHGLEVHVRTLDGYGNDTRVEGLFDFFLLRRGHDSHGRPEETILADWRRPAHLQRLHSGDRTFTHYVYCLPCSTAFLQEGGLVLRVRLITDTGKRLSVEQPLSVPGRK